MMASRQHFALVTGCVEGGIGEALTKEFAAKGLHVIATVLPGETRVHLDNPDITTFELDVTKEETILSLKDNVAELTSGKLDVLVNNAGICYTMTAIDTDVHAVQKMFDVNVFGPMRMVHHFHNLLIRAEGAIVNIGSIGGLVPYPYGAAYNASKAALVHYGNTCRVELAPLGVRVINIISGEVGTNILKADSHRELPKGSYYSPLAEEFKAHVQRKPKTTDRFVYARQVVSQSLESHPPAWAWIGSLTGLVRFFDIFGFRRVWDYILWPMFSFNKLKEENWERMKEGF